MKCLQRPVILNEGREGGRGTEERDGGGWKEGGREEGGRDIRMEGGRREGHREGRREGECEV